MQNVKPEVYAALLRAHPRVFPTAPDTDAVLPCVSYLEFNNTTAAGADDDEYTASSVIIVDIWGVTPETISVVMLDVDREMNAIGYVRTGCTDVPPKDGDDVHHKNMTYERTD